MGLTSGGITPMGNRKSHIDVGFYVDVIRNVCADAYAVYPGIPSRELDRDIITIKRRVAAEGLEFLTKTLPVLGKALDQALETGQLILPQQFSAKRKAGVKWNIPKLFSELFLTIFDREGRLVHDTNTAVGFIRQICYVCYKLECPYTPEQVLTCLRKFRDLDSNLVPVKPAIQKHAKVFLIARSLLRRLFSNFDAGDITPRHGRGAVADRLRGREKYDVQFYSRKIDRWYPYSRYATFGILSQALDDLVDYIHLPEEIPPARVVCVPKDSRGPRIISCEPALLQFLQQGLARKMVGRIQKHYLTRGRVLFRDQLSHRELAKQSSKDGRYATLDMSDASDRVSLDLVRNLFPRELVPYLVATRSETTQLPDGELVKLQKFAPMGSALCFPIEALCFWSLATAVVWTVSRDRARRRSPVFVYGDDIIVPTKAAASVISVLEDFGLQFNRDKCFMRGKFRESCGCDAFNFEDVTPVKIRVPVMHSRGRRTLDMYRLSKNANNFFDRGYWRTAEYIWRKVERIVGPLPYTSSAFSGISRSSSILPCNFPLPMGGNKVRWSDRLQRLEVWTTRPRARSSNSPFLKEIHRLFHDLTLGQEEPYDDFVAVPHSALPKAGWAPLL